MPHDKLDKRCKKMKKKIIYFQMTEKTIKKKKKIV